MPQYRQDPLTGRWAIIAEGRADRPVIRADSLKMCPFCPGNEAKTPQEIDVIRPDNATDISDWAVRVVPNKFPAVTKDAGARAGGVNPPRILPPTVAHNGMTCAPPLRAILGGLTPPALALVPLPGLGNHEVIIDTPRHIGCISEMTDEECRNLFQMYRRRLRTIRQDRAWAYTLIFKNVGEASGATVHHSHSQLVSMPFQPPSVQHELSQAIVFRQKNGVCYWCTHIESELKSGVRIVEETQEFVLLCPYLSRFPAEMTIFPKKHISHFDLLSDPDIAELAELTRRAAIRMKHLNAELLGDRPLAYNMVLKSGPFDRPEDNQSTKRKRVPADDTAAAYHFYISILPCLTKVGGFEWGAGIHINPMSPETAAEKYRTPEPEPEHESEHVA